MAISRKEKRQAGWVLLVLSLGVSYGVFLLMLSTRAGWSFLLWVTLSFVLIFACMGLDVIIDHHNSYGEDAASDLAVALWFFAVLASAVYNDYYGKREDALAEKIVAETEAAMEQGYQEAVKSWNGKEDEHERPLERPGREER